MHTNHVTKVEIKQLIDDIYDLYLLYLYCEEKNYNSFPHMDYLIMEGNKLVDNNVLKKSLLLRRIDEAVFFLMKRDMIKVALFNIHKNCPDNTPEHLAIELPSGISIFDGYKVSSDEIEQIIFDDIEIDDFKYMFGGEFDISAWYHRARATVTYMMELTDGNCPKSKCDQSNIGYLLGDRTIESNHLWHPLPVFPNPVYNAAKSDVLNQTYTISSLNFATFVNGGTSFNNVSISTGTLSAGNPIGYYGQIECEHIPTNPPPDPPPNETSFVNVSVRWDGRWKRWMLRYSSGTSHPHLAMIKTDTELSPIGSYYVDYEISHNWHYLGETHREGSATII